MCVCVCVFVGGGGGGGHLENRGGRVEKREREAGKLRQNSEHYIVFSNDSTKRLEALQKGSGTGRKMRAAGSSEGPCPPPPPPTRLPPPLLHENPDSHPF